MFAIGDKEWPGISKLVEECGETLQIAGKLMGTGGEAHHWDGEGDLRDRLQNELADLGAAIWFVAAHCGLDQAALVERMKRKRERFDRWHELGLTNLLTLRDVACVVCAQTFTTERPRANASETICATCFEAGK